MKQVWAHATKTGKKALGELGHNPVGGRDWSGDRRKRDSRCENWESTGRLGGLLLSSEKGNDKLEGAEAALVMRGKSWFGGN